MGQPIEEEGLSPEFIEGVLDVQPGAELSGEPTQPGETPFRTPLPAFPPPQPRAPTLDPRRRVQHGWEVTTRFGTAVYPDGTLPVFDWVKMGQPQGITPFFTDFDRVLIYQAAVMFDPSLPNRPELASELMHRFESLAEDDPAIIDLFIADAEAALAMTSEQVMNTRAFTHYRSMLRLEDRSVSEAAWNAARESIHSQYGKVFSGGQLLNNMDLVRNQFEAGEITAETIPGEGGHALEVTGTFGDFTAENRISVGQAFLVPKFGRRGGTWAMDDFGNLAMRLEDGTGAWTMLVRLDEGTVVRSHNDAVKAVLDAMTGEAHILDPTSDKVPRTRTLRGTLWKGFGDAVRYVEDVGGGFLAAAFDEATRAPAPSAAAVSGSARPRPTSEERQSQQEERLRRVSIEAVNDEFVLGSLINAASIQQERFLTGGEIVLAADALFALPESEFSEIRDELAALTTEDAIKQFREAKDRQGVIGSFVVEEIVQPAIELFTLWDHVIHSTAIGIYDFIVNQVPDAARALYGDDLDPSSVGEPTDALTPFVNAYRTAREFDNAAEFFGWDPDSGWGATFNFTVSVAADPITWVTMSGPASWRWAVKAVTDESLTHAFIRQPRYVSFARQLVNLDRPHMLAPMVGRMRPATALRLNEIATTQFPTRAARKEARDEVLELLRKELPAHGGRWIPNEPHLARLRQGALGLGELARKAGTGDGKTKRTLLDLLQRSQRSRAVRITREEAVDTAAEMLTWGMARNPGRFRELFSEFMGVYDDFVRGNPEMQTVIANKITELRASAIPAKDTVSRFRHVEQLRVEIEQLRRVLQENVESGGRKLDDTFDEIAQVEAQIGRKESELSALDEAVYDNAQTEVRALTHEIEKLTHQLRHVEDFGDVSQIERFVHKLFDEIAEDAGVPIIPDEAHPWFDDLPLRDWSAVTGKADKARWYPEMEADRLLPFFDNLSVEAQRRLKALGILDRRVQTILPVSPQELVAYRAMNRTKAGQKLWGIHIESKAKAAVSSALNAITGMFVYSVLLNPLTPTKTHLDEILRFYTRHGFFNKRLYRALVLRDPETARALRFGEQASSPLVTQMRTWGPIARGEKGHIQSAERWVNGSLLEDPSFAVYARAKAAQELDEVPAEWVDWFDTVGHRAVSPAPIKWGPGPAKKIDAELAWAIMDQSFEAMIELSARPGMVRSTILDAAAQGRKVTNDGIWRHMGTVPGQALERRGFGHNVFDAFYGAPQRRRGAAFYDHYYEQASRIYRQAHQGRILGTSEEFIDDTRRILGEAGVPEEQIVPTILAGQANPQVRELVRRGGYVLERDLEADVARWASQNADSLMYTFGAVSSLGRASQRVYPFGRAQLDYLNYWARELFAPTTFRSLSGKPLTLKVAPGRALPLNLRLWDRIGKVSTFTGNDEDGRPRDGEPFTPEWGADVFTFLPTRFDESFLLDIVPSTIPVLSWMVNFAPREIDEDTSPIWKAAARLRDIFEEFNPSHEIFNDFENRGVADTVNSGVNALLPRNPRSLRGMLEGLTAAGAAAFGGEFIDLVEQIPFHQEPRGYRDFYATETAEWLINNPNHAFPATDRDGNPLDFEMQGVIEQLSANAARQAYSREANNFIQSNFPLIQAEVFNDDLNGHVRLWEPVLVNVDRWVSEGWIAGGAGEDIALSAAKVSEWLATGEGEPEVRDLRVLSDALYDAWGALPRYEQARIEILNPGLAVNLVSTAEVRLDRVPDEVRPSLLGNRVNPTLPANTIRDLYRRGRDEGWVVSRDDSAVFLDRMFRRQSAARAYLKHIFEDLTGKGWGAPGQGRTTEWAQAPAGISVESEHWEVLKALDLLDEIPPDGQRIDDEGRFFGEWFRITGNDGQLVGVLTTNKALKDWLGPLRNRFTFRNRSPDAEVLLRRNDDSSEMAFLDQMAAERFGWEIEPGYFQPASRYGSDLLDRIEAVEKFGRDMGFDSPADWPDEFVIPGDPSDPADDVRMLEVDWPAGTVLPLGAIREDIRLKFRAAVTLGTMDPEGGFDRETYDNFYSRDYGNLDYEAPDPPPLSELDTNSVTTTPDRVRVVDGDTLAIATTDGEIFFRLLGINAPEVGNANYTGSLTDPLQITGLGAGADIGAASSHALRQFLDGATTITLGIWEPDTFGRTQIFRRREPETGAVVDRERVFVWLYVDGFPVYDAAEFSAVNPRGVGIGGDDVIDYEAIWQRPPEGEAA